MIYGTLDSLFVYCVVCNISSKMDTDAVLGTHYKSRFGGFRADITHGHVLGI